VLAIRYRYVSELMLKATKRTSRTSQDLGFDVQLLLPEWRAQSRMLAVVSSIQIQNYRTTLNLIISNLRGNSFKLRQFTLEVFDLVFVGLKVSS